MGCCTSKSIPWEFDVPYESSNHDRTFFERDTSYQQVMRDQFSYYPGWQRTWGERDDFAPMEAVRVGTQPVGWPVKERYHWRRTDRQECF